MLVTGLEVAVAVEAADSVELGLEEDGVGDLGNVVLVAVC